MLWDIYVNGPRGRREEDATKSTLEYPNTSSADTGAVVQYAARDLGVSADRVLALPHRGGGVEGASEVRLKDRERGQVTLRLRDGVVVGAMGSEPQRFMGLTLERARHVARYGGSGVRGGVRKKTPPVVLKREIDAALAKPGRRDKR